MKFVSATAEGTARFAQRHRDAGAKGDGFRVLGRTGLTVSSVGFGCQNVSLSDARHREALQVAFRSGCNLVDSAAHYSAGDAEELVCAVSAEASDITRDEVVIISKTGTFTGMDLDWLKAQGLNNPTCLTDEPNVWRSFHPSSIQGQVERSRRRLGVETIDIVLLESPEFLYDAAMEVNPDGTEEEHTAFVFNALEAAFHSLEHLVRDGVVQWYGVTSSALSVTLADDMTLPLVRLMEIAERQGGKDHHFGLVQMPMSVFSAASYDESDESTVTECAKRMGLGVMVGQTLRPVVDGRIIQLTDFETKGRVRLDRLVRATGALEREFEIGLGRAFDVEGHEGSARLFDNAWRLNDVAESLGDYVLWREFVEDALEMELSGLIGQIDAGLTGPLKAAWTFWLERYIQAISRLVDGLSLKCARLSQKRSRRIAGKLRGLLPKSVPSRRLAPVSVAVMRGLPGVDSVLVGMRRSEYVVEVMGTLQWDINVQQPRRVERIARQQLMPDA